MGIEKLSSSFLLACSRILTREVETHIPCNYLLRHSPLLTSNSVRPSVTCTNVGPAMATLHCQYRLDLRGQNIIQTPKSRSYAMKQSSGHKHNSNKTPYDTTTRYTGLDSSRLKLGFENIKELEDADERVKKIFSLEYANDSEILAYRKAKLVEKIQMDPTDDSFAVRIALTTLTIRTAAKTYARNKKDIRAKTLLLGSVGRRRRMLKFLRKTDYQRFEKLLVQLGITYTLPPPVNAFRRHSRRYLEKLTVWRKAREQRLEAMDRYLAEQREAKMGEIAELKKELGIEFTKEEMKYLENETDKES